jgi:ABC-type sugar transport system ATPase subunit
MTLKERISDLFNEYSVALEVEEKKEEEKEVKMATATLDSGQEISTDAEAFAVGVSVFVVNDEGEQIPLPDGEYTLADGMAFVVAEGVISEIKEPEAVEEAPAAEVVEEALSREEVVSLIAKAVAEAKKEFSSQIEERDAKITELSKQAAPSLSRAPKMEVKAPVDLKSLSITERVAAIHNQFSK